MSTPVQIVLGVPDPAGALFLFADDMRVIGEPADCERVLAVAQLCDGSRTDADVVAAADVSSAAIILRALRDGDVVVDSPRERDADLPVANRLLATFVGPGRLVSELEAYRPCLDDDSLLPYFAASGRFAYSNGTPYNSFGTAPTPAGAVLRAIAEAVERFEHGNAIRIDAFGTPDVGPTRVFASISHQQPTFLAARGLSPFDPADEHPWVRAHSLVTGEPALLLADTVYYPTSSAQLGRPKVSEALASGTAAHFDRDDAIRRALLELIERDALAVTWASHREVTALPLTVAPPAIRERITQWAERGRTFTLVDLTLDSVPVVLAISRADTYPHITAGCAAALTYEAAIEKAFLESETIAVTWATNIEPRPEPTAVRSAIDHGLLYAHPGNEHRVAWLLDAPTAVPPARTVDWDAIVRRFDPFVVDLHAGELHVVKVLSDALLPITFGHGSEPHGHPRLAQLGLAWGEYPCYPHFFA